MRQPSLLGFAEFLDLDVHLQAREGANCSRDDAQQVALSGRREVLESQPPHTPAYRQGGVTRRARALDRDGIGIQESAAGGAVMRAIPIPGAVCRTRQHRPGGRDEMPAMCHRPMSTVTSPISNPIKHRLLPHAPPSPARSRNRLPCGLSLAAGLRNCHGTDATSTPGVKCQTGAGVGSGCRDLLVPVADDIRM